MRLLGDDVKADRTLSHVYASRITRNFHTCTIYATRNEFIVAQSKRLGLPFGTVTGNLLSAIREKQQRLLDLKREIASVEAELREAKAILGERPREAGRVGIRKRPIRQRSTVWWAKQALTHHAKPMHIDDLVKRVEEFSSQGIRKSTLVSNLSRYVRSRDTFTRPEEGIYGLIEFEGESEGAERPLLEAGVAKR